jgi:exopolysaccharide production protein ExoY
MSKRFLDIILSVFILLFFAPILLCILAIVTYLTKASPIIVQKRKLTLEKKSINIWKIRTIIESKNFRNLESNTKKIFNKPEFEKFIPPFCRWLRKSGIDEIPQLINVIKGELSLVGPRPMLESDLKLMKENEPNIYRIRTFLKSKPGITGYWQLFGEREEGSKNLVTLDTFYEFNKSFLLDFKLILKTMVVMLGAKHSDSIVSNKFINNERIESKIFELSFEQDQP